ncbi:MAG: LysM peptidoglycan-binding domain-containing M23 family metallopeptidase [Spirochaetes bacterium]|nr:LysM peptidoglycan-binding domain-containing M23 family metallopeptidase [Spirochaetota bacterium]
MTRYRYICPALLAVMVTAAGLRADHPPMESISSLDPVGNAMVRTIRDDVRRSIYTIKSGRSVSGMPSLRFYRYRVRQGDSFWNIMAKLSMDIDTLMTVNDLSSPGSLTPGRVLFIPNMRGIMLKNRGAATLTAQLRENGIDVKYVLRANNTSDLNREYVFIPCGKVSNLQRSLFLGIAFMNPLRIGRQTSGFGTRRDPFNRRRSEFHAGIDIACPMRTGIHAARNGRVVFSGYRGNYGKLVILEHEHGYQSYYGHLSTIGVRPGQTVSRGDLIALSGNTGRTTGPHLHFEVRKRNRPVNPGILLR